MESSIRGADALVVRPWLALKTGFFVVPLLRNLRKRKGELSPRRFSLPASCQVGQLASGTSNPKKGGRRNGKSRGSGLVKKSLSAFNGE